jgi:hypothetical protein
MPHRSGGETVLREIPGVSEDPGGNTCRWFHDDYFDLFVRENPSGEIVGLELCYGVGHAEHALVWKKGLGHFHDGPQADHFDAEDLASRFAAECGDLPHRISTSVLRTIRDFAQDVQPGRPSRRRFRREDWQGSEDTAGDDA